MKRLWMVACLALGSLCCASVVFAQADMKTDGRTTVWQHSEVTYAVSGNWTLPNWQLGNNTNSDFTKNPTAEFNALISGFNAAAGNKPAVITINNAKATPAAANRLLLYGSTSGNAADTLTLNIRGHATVASIEATRYGGSTSEAIIINHSSGTVNITGSTWSAAGSSTPGGGGTINPVYKAATWKAWSSFDFIQDEGTYIAWTNDAKTMPLYFAGWPIGAQGDAMYAVIEYYSPSLNQYLLGNNYQNNDPDDNYNTLNTAFEAWENNNWYNPNAYKFDGTKWYWDVAGLNKANTYFVPTDQEDTDLTHFLFKKNDNPIFLGSTELGISPLTDSMLAGDRYLLIDPGVDGEGNPTKYLYLLDLEDLYRINGYEGFSYLEVERYTGGSGGSSGDDLPGVDNNPAASRLLLGVLGDTGGSRYVLGAARLDDGSADADADSSKPTLKVGTIEIAANGRNIFDARKGGVLQTAEIVHTPVDGHRAKDDFTFFNDGAEVQFLYARDGEKIVEKAAGQSALLTVAGNYSNVGREAGNSGILRMSAYNRAGAYGDGNASVLYMDTDGTMSFTAGTDLKSYKLFESDLLQVTKVDGFGDITGDLITGGTLMLDLSALEAALADLKNYDGVALKLFDVEKDGNAIDGVKGNIINGSARSTYFDSIVDANALPASLVEGLFKLGASGYELEVLNNQAWMSGHGILLLGLNGGGEGGGEGVPEPSTVVLLLLGLAGLYYTRKKHA